MLLSLHKQPQDWGTKFLHSPGVLINMVCQNSEKELDITHHGKKKEKIITVYTM
jgi:hypothetical protein